VKLKDSLQFRYCIYHNISAGKHVTGEYTIKEPGGNVRTVKYHADPHGGFFAHVQNSGGNDHSGGTYGGHGHENHHHGHHDHY
jgi:hypothetical protein